MNKQTKPYKDPLKIGKYTVYGALAWTVTLAILLSWNIHQINSDALDRAYVYTKVGFDKDLLYRRWAANHGGVYVKIDSTTPPSPYLSHIPDSDIIIDSNLRLTLMNPAYMTRQVYELEMESSGVQGHLTSLKPIRHGNEADEWEQKALQAFEKGIEEFAEISSINGVEYFRFMKPFITEESCLKCHAHQGYKLNDIRGGISVSYPMEQVYTLIQSDIRNQYSLYGIIWILGLLIIAIAFQQIKKSDAERIVAEESLLRMNSQLEDRVRNRTKKLQEEITERQLAEELVQKNQLQYEALFNFGADAIYLSDLDGNIIRTNNQAVKEMGYSKEEFQQLKVWDLDQVYPDVDAVKAFWNTLELNRPVTIESVHKRKDGSLLPIELRVNLTEIKGQKSILGFVRNIRDRKQAEKELTFEKEFSEKLINTSSAIIIGLDEKHLIRIFNNGAENTTGYTEAEMIGKDWFKIFFPKERLDEMNRVWESAWGISSHAYENPILIKTGKERMISWQNTGVYEGGDSSKHLLISIGEDITEKKQVELELQKHRNHLEELIKDRTQQLEDKNNALERVNKLFVGREIRMKELKEEIERLKNL